jgi:hypothetical protein
MKLQQDIVYSKYNTQLSCNYFVCWTIKTHLAMLYISCNSINVMMLMMRCIFWQEHLYQYEHSPSVTVIEVYEQI